MNQVQLVGNLGKDPELRYTQNQTAVVQLAIATNELAQNGETKTEWHRIVVWGKQAEACQKFLTKGRKVAVVGRLQTRSWNDQSGQTKYVTEIVANHVEFLSAAEHATAAAEELDNHPYAQQANQQAQAPQQNAQQQQQYGQYQQRGAQQYPPQQQQHPSPNGGSMQGFDPNKIPF